MEALLPSIKKLIFTENLNSLFDGLSFGNEASTPASAPTPAAAVCLVASSTAITVVFRFTGSPASVMTCLFCHFLLWWTFFLPPPWRISISLRSTEGLWSAFSSDSAAVRQFYQHGVKDTHGLFGEEIK